MGGILDAVDPRVDALDAGSLSPGHVEMPRVYPSDLEVSFSPTKFGEGTKFASNRY